MAKIKKAQTGTSTSKAEYDKQLALHKQRREAIGSNDKAKLKSIGSPYDKGKPYNINDLQIDQKKLQNIRRKSGYGMLKDIVDIQAPNMYQGLKGAVKSELNLKKGGIVKKTIAKKVIKPIAKKIVKSIKKKK